MKVMTLAALAAVALLSALFAGCGGTTEDDATTTTGAPTTVNPSSAAPAAPGLYDLPGGRKQALGVLQFRDLEGGFWAVVEAFEGQATEESRVVAVVANAASLGVDLESLEGKYVAAEGKILEGASIRMAGPELEADKLVRVEEMTVEGAGAD